MSIEWWWLWSMMRLNMDSQWCRCYTCIVANDIPSQFLLLFFQANFQRLSPLKFADRWTSNFMWGILVRVSTKVMEIMLIKHFLSFLQWFLHLFSSIFKFSENPGLIDFKFYARHPGEGLYQRYGNYADPAILSAEHQGLWAFCWLINYIDSRYST